jgi:hypothetical protein
MIKYTIRRMGHVADVLVNERVGSRPVADIGTRTVVGEPAPAETTNRMSR